MGNGQWQLAFGLAIGGPAAVIDAELAVFQLGNLRGHPIQQEAIVRGEDHGANVVVERLLQLILRRHVQMVGRLVEQQQLAWFQ